MKLLQPSWLLLLIPVLIFFQRWKIPNRTTRGIRILVVFSLFLALMGVFVNLPEQEGYVVIVVDRSRSMPPETDDTAGEIIRNVQRARPEGNHLSVVAFGEKSGIEMMGKTGMFSSFQQIVGKNGSNFSDALNKAVSLIPLGVPGRIMFVSDGKWTGRNPGSAMIRAAQEGVPCDFRLLSRIEANDLSVLRIDTPENVTPGESFLLIAWLKSPISQEVSYELTRGNTKLDSGKTKIPAGVSRLVFRDRMTEPGNFRYQLVISGEMKDSIPENNIAQHLLACLGPKKALLLSSSSGSSFGNVLQSGGLETQRIDPEKMDWSIERLSDFSAVILENIPAGKIGVHGMKTLEMWVKEAAGGLMMTGGKNAYGSGGYFRSPLEPILPVSMELRGEHRKLSLAIAIVLDRSGSMNAPTPAGVTKMEMANAATVQVLDLLSAMDELGVIAVDSAPHIVQELESLNNKDSMRSKILRIESTGGGIFVYEGLLAAYKMLSQAKAQNKHIILFSDAADSEEPGNYKELMEKGASANVTVSVIGLGTQTDCDAMLLEDIARRGNGRIFFTIDADELPRLFAQETFMVAKSSFVDEPVKVLTTPGLTTLLGKPFSYSGTVGGYNLSYIRPEAILGMVSQDEYNAPIVSAWNVGIGRTLCYAGEADGKFTGDIGKWDSASDFLTSLGRWASGYTDILGWNTMATQRLVDGICVIDLHLDPDREKDPFSKPPIVKSIRNRPQQDLQSTDHYMEWTSPDVLTTKIPLTGDDILLNTIVLARNKTQTMPPVCLPYSPEFQATGPEKGPKFLETLGKLTRGKERIDPTTVWKDLPKKDRYFDLSPFFLFLAIFLLLMEVLERRTGVISQIRFFGRQKAGQQLKQMELDEFVPIPRKPELTIPSLVKTPEEKSETAPPSPKTRKNRALIDALNKAQNRARNRTK